MRPRSLALAWTALLCVASGCTGESDEGTARYEPSLGGTPLQSGLLVNGDVLPLQAGRSGPYSFLVPEDALSIVVTVIGHPSAIYWLCDWRSGDGFDLALDNVSGECANCANRITPRSSIFTTLAPNSSTAHVAGGQHRLSICGSDVQSEPIDGHVRLYVHAKSGPAIGEVSVIDVNLFFSGANGLTATAAKGDPSFLQTVDEVRDILRGGGIEIGNVSHADLPSGYQEPTSTDRDQLCASVESDLPAGINVFFFGSTGGASTGGIPGPLVLNTASSGIFLSVGAIAAAGRTLSIVMAHEIGHFLGLYHTSEVLFSGGDPLDDTPDDDLSYLMHGQAEGTKLSAGQGRVMRLNPFAKP